MSAPLTFAEYFAGIGLVRLGLEQHGWRAVYANDIDPKKHEMYAAYFQGENGLYQVDDIHGLDPHRIPSATLATASFPCIDMSVAGNQAGFAGRHSSTFWGLVRILWDMLGRRPRLIMLENVVGWLTTNGGEDFRRAIQAVNDIGYVCDVFVLNAQHFVPQSRPRLFVVGALDARPNDSILETYSRRPQALYPDHLRKAIAASPGLRLMALPLPAPPPLLRGGLSDLLEKIPDGDSRWWPEEKVGHLLKDQLSERHRRLLEHLKGQNKVFFATAYKRVRAGGTRAEIRTDGISGCLRTPVGGSSRQLVVAAGQGAVRVRWMSGREYARLQGVPDAYPITVRERQSLWGFGDAVCVPAIAWIAEHALNPLALAEYSS